MGNAENNGNTDSIIGEISLYYEEVRSVNDRTVTFAKAFGVLLFVLATYILFALRTSLDPEFWTQYKEHRRTIEYSIYSYALFGWLFSTALSLSASIAIAELGRSRMLKTRYWRSCSILREELHRRVGAIQTHGRKSTTKPRFTALPTGLEVIKEPYTVRFRLMDKLISLARLICGRLCRKNRAGSRHRNGAAAPEAGDASYSFAPLIRGGYYWRGRLLIALAITVPFVANLFFATLASLCYAGFPATDSLESQYGIIARAFQLNVLWTHFYVIIGVNLYATYRRSLELSKLVNPDQIYFNAGKTSFWYNRFLNFALHILNTLVAALCLAIWRMCEYMCPFVGTGHRSAWYWYEVLYDFIIPLFLVLLTIGVRWMRAKRECRVTAADESWDASLVNIPNDLNATS